MHLNRQGTMAYGSVAAERTRQIARREVQRRSREERSKGSLALAEVVQPPSGPSDEPTGEWSQTMQNLASVY